MIQKTLVLHLTNESYAAVQQAMKWMEEVVPFQVLPASEPLVNREGFLLHLICVYYNQMVSPEDH
jgi:hypothetical protein